MTRNDRRFTPDRRSPERRHTVRSKMTALGYLLCLSAVSIVMFQLWTLLQG